MGQLDNAKAILEQGLNALPDNTEIQAKLLELEFGLAENSNDLSAEDESRPIAQDFTADELSTMEEIFQGIVRMDYEFLFNYLYSPDVTHLFNIDVDSRNGLENLYMNKDESQNWQRFVWESEHGEIEFYRGFAGDEIRGRERTTHETYGVEFGDMENGIYYKLYWGEVYSTLHGVTVSINAINHRDGLSNGQYNVYNYYPNSIQSSHDGHGADILLNHKTGTAFDGVKHGIEKWVQTWKDGTSETGEFNYVNGIFDTEGYSGGDNINYIGRHFNAERNVYDFMSN
jgi:hypothetical protein